MTRAEEAALEYNCALCNTDVRHCGLRKSPGINCKDCNLFILGYEQAEKDLALTINDLELLHTFLYAIKNNKQGCFTFTRLSNEQYEEILRRFNEAKQ